MIDIRNTKRHYDWETAPREVRESRWSKLYVTLKPQGEIWLSRFTYQALGEPDSFLLLYDRSLNVLGMQPARLAVTKNAYPVVERGRHGARAVQAFRMMREFNIHLSETARFPRCFIDQSGTLILELNDVRPAGKKRKKNSYGY